MVPFPHNDPIIEKEKENTFTTDTRILCGFGPLCLSVFKIRPK